MTVCCRERDHYGLCRSCSCSVMRDVMHAGWIAVHGNIIALPLTPHHLMLCLVVLFALRIIPWLDLSHTKTTEFGILGILVWPSFTFVRYGLCRIYDIRDISFESHRFLCVCCNHTVVSLWFMDRQWTVIFYLRAVRWTICFAVGLRCLFDSSHGYSLFYASVLNRQWNLRRMCNRRFVCSVLHLFVFTPETARVGSVVPPI